jgi:hypothetical protein
VPASSRSPFAAALAAALVVVPARVRVFTSRRNVFFELGFLAAEFFFVPRVAVEEVVEVLRYLLLALDRFRFLSAESMCANGGQSNTSVSDEVVHRDEKKCVVFARWTWITRT